MQTTYSETNRSSSFDEWYELYCKRVAEGGGIKPVKSNPEIKQSYDNGLTPLELYVSAPGFSRR